MSRFFENRIKMLGKEKLSMNDETQPEKELVRFEKRDTWAGFS
ncbi:conserved hypothetical protein [delta proteobacterium NaphS2]|nr:conserved hypothetical protein [delta proteobacterium NaphS2]